MSYLRALADMDGRLRNASEQRAANDNICALLVTTGESVAQLSRELAEAHTELAMLRRAIDDRNDVIASLQAHLDEMERGT